MHFNSCIICGKDVKRQAVNTSFCSEACADKWAEDVTSRCKKCGEKLEGKGVRYATETEPEQHYRFCTNMKSGCFNGW